MTYPVQKNNRVKFLMDGEEIFAALKDGFDAVARAAPKTPQTYVRMAFWLIAHDIMLGDLTAWGFPTNTILKHIERVLLAGYDVQLILWYPNYKERQFIPEQPIEHDKLARNIGTLDAYLNGLTKGTSGRAMVYKERYEGWTGESQHQKFAIFSVNGQRTVVLGGLNLAQRYFDNVTHSVQFGTDNTNWHDTAVEIEGPVTVDIEDEWMRRWRKVIDIADAKIPTERLSNHLTAPGITDEWKKSGAADVVTNTTAQAVFTVGRLGTYHRFVPTQVGLTRSGKASRVTEIHDLILDRIEGATQRIYMENNQFTDPDIVRAIYKRQAAVRGLQVIIVTNPSSGGAGYLTRRAWLHMALRHPSCRSVTYKSKHDTSGYKTLKRGTGKEWQVMDTYEPATPTSQQWLETDGIRIAKTSTGTHLQDNKIKLFHEIVDVDVDFHFYTPVEHTGWWDVNKDGSFYAPTFRSLVIHSKLAIIDDYLVCGSANWTYRSMKYDGEISLFMQQAGLADDALDRLLNHFERFTALDNTKLGSIEATAQGSVDNILKLGYPHIPCPGDLQLLPLEYRRNELGPALCVYWGEDSPAHSWKDRLQHPKERFEGLKTDLPNWTWW